MFENTTLINALPVHASRLGNIETAELWKRHSAGVECAEGMREGQGQTWAQRCATCLLILIEELRAAGALVWYMGFNVPKVHVRAMSRRTTVLRINLGPWE